MFALRQRDSSHLLLGRLLGRTKDSPGSRIGGALSGSLVYPSLFLADAGRSSIQKIQHSKSSYAVNHDHRFLATPSPFKFRAAFQVVEEQKSQKYSPQATNK